MRVVHMVRVVLAVHAVCAVRDTNDTNDILTVKDSPKISIFTSSDSSFWVCRRRTS